MGEARPDFTACKALEPWLSCQPSGNILPDTAKRCPIAAANRRQNRTRSGWHEPCLRNCMSSPDFLDQKLGIHANGAAGTGPAARHHCLQYRQCRYPGLQGARPRLQGSIGGGDQCLALSRPCASIARWQHGRARHRAGRICRKRRSIPGDAQLSVGSYSRHHDGIEGRRTSIETSITRRRDGTGRSLSLPSS